MLPSRNMDVTVIEKDIANGKNKKENIATTNFTGKYYAGSGFTG